MCFPVPSTDPQKNDKQPRELIAPRGKSFGLRLVDDPPLFSGEPGTIPYWFLAVCLLPPLCVAVWHWSRELAKGVNDPFLVQGFVITCLAFPGIWTIIYLLNRWVASLGSFFVLDTVAGTLMLPRSGITIDKVDLVEFIQLSAWHSADHEHERMHELIAVQANDEGEFSYHSVAIDSSKSRIARAGQRLSEFFDVPLRVTKV